MTNTDASGGSLWGPFMEDALRLIVAGGVKEEGGFLLHTTSNAFEYGHRQYMVKLWIRQASLVHIEGRDAGETLLKRQQYITVTQPEKRCPCEHGVELSQAADHFPECDAACTLRKRELQLGVLQDEEIALAKKKLEIEAGWQMEQDGAMELKALWSASTPAQLGIALLKSMKTAIRDELFRRYSTFPTSSTIIASFAAIFCFTPPYHILHNKADFSLST